MKRAAVIFALATAFAGCTTTLTRLPVPKGLEADGLHPIETVEVSNAALLFFSLLPIASGDPKSPNGGDVRWFEETTTLENQMKMLEAEAARVGATRAVNVQTLQTDESFLVFILKREKIHTSAVLVRDASGRQGADATERVPPVRNREGRALSCPKSANREGRALSRP